METLKEMQKDLAIDYQAKFDKLKKITYELYELGYEDLSKEVMKKMAGLKMLIDYINE